MECTVTWTGASGAKSPMGFVAGTGSGHVLVMDGAVDEARPENGGHNQAPRPMETVLAGTGGLRPTTWCSSSSGAGTTFAAARNEAGGRSRPTPIRRSSPDPHALHGAGT